MEEARDDEFNVTNDAFLAEVSGVTVTVTFNDRQQRVNLAVHQNSEREMVDNTDDLIQSLNDRNERRWQDMLRTVVNCVALRRKCDRHVGRFLNDNYQHWTQKKRNHITRHCTYSKKSSCSGM